MTEVSHENIADPSASELAKSVVSTQNDELFGSFLLAGNEFAISIRCIQEVVNPPESYTSLPLSPNYLVGLFNLRGAIIPVIDLQNLLNLKETERPPERKIAILELDGHCVGIVFDKTGDIFKENKEERNEFIEEKDKYNCIKGVFKRDNGKQIVQILDTSVLLKLDKIPKLPDHLHRRRNLLNQRVATKKCISFTIGPAECALDIAEIQEIIKIQKLTNTALAGNNCVGDFDLRGTTVPIIDFGALLKYRKPQISDVQFSGDRRVIVLRLGNELFGLLVDSVNSIITYYNEDLKSFPNLNSERADMFAGCISIEGKNDTLLLNAKNIFSNEEIKQITHGHSEIYKSKKDSGRDTTDKHSRRTFITFKVEGHFAVQIGQLKEIIKYPSNILKPPGLAKAFHGVYNLRGDFILIVAARQLYSQPKQEEGLKLSKVLIFKIDGLHFGLVVDSVEAIRTFSDGDIIKIPDILYKDSGLSEDVSEAIQARESDGTTNNLLILNPESIAKRVKSLKSA